MSKKIVPVVLAESEREMVYNQFLFFFFSKKTVLVITYTGTIVYLKHVEI